MKKVVAELRQIIDDFALKLDVVPEHEFSARPHATKWTKKEVLGHLIDSAQSNLRRFVCGQYEATPPKIVYDQDFWVKANGYNDVKKEDIICLWRLINLRIVDVLRTMPVENHTRECDTSKQTVVLHTLEWLAADYVKHMKHHLNQLIEGSFSITYP